MLDTDKARLKEGRALGSSMPTGPPVMASSMSTPLIFPFRIRILVSDPPAVRKCFLSHVSGIFDPTLDHFADFLKLLLHIQIMFSFYYFAIKTNSEKNFEKFCFAVGSDQQFFFIIFWSLAGQG